MTDTPPKSYLSPKVEVRHLPQKGGHGVFALQKINKDEVVGILSGIVVTYDDVQKFTPEQRSRAAQIEEGFYIFPLRMDDPPDYINHSCNPNVGFSGQMVIVAMRDIEVGEEVCFDYAMCDSTAFDEFPCGCGAPNCRQQVTGNDWQRPDVQQRYAGYFMPYLQKKINKLKTS